MRRAGFVADLLHRSLGGQAAAHRLGDAGDPAAVGGEHAVGFEDVAVLAVAEPRLATTSRRSHSRIAATACRSRSSSAFDVLGDDLADRQARLVQHRGPDRQPGIEPDAVQPDREHSRRLGSAPFRAD